MIHCIHCGTALPSYAEHCCGCGHTMGRAEWYGHAVELTAPDSPDRFVCPRCGSAYGLADCPVCGLSRTAAFPPEEEVTSAAACPHCGGMLAQQAVFCSFCGRPVTETAPSAPPGNQVHPGQPIVGGHFTADPGVSVPPPPPGAPGPKYDRVQPQQPDGGLTTAQYFWTLMLFAVPVVGLLFMLYWSFGSTASPARRRLARASLIKAGVALATGLVTLVTVGIFALRIVQTFRLGQNWYNGYGNYGYYGGFGDDFEDFYGFPYDFFGNNR